MPKSIVLDTSEYDVTISAKEQKALLWKSLVSHNKSSALSSNSSEDNSTAEPSRCPMDREWPTYDSLIAHVATQDYKKNLTCPFDVNPDDKAKAICPHGVVCCAKMELFPFPQSNDEIEPYSGLLQPGTTVEHCMVRLSSAIRPLEQGIESDWARAMIRRSVGEKLSKAKIVPGAAIKCFRGNNTPSGNLLFLGSKVGQREEDFFAHCLCTTMTEKMPAVALPFVKKFFRYSSYPLSLGISDFAAFDQDGTDHRGEQHNFPFAVTLKPLLEMPGTSASNDTQPERCRFDTFDSFIDSVVSVPKGTPLFDIYASPDPDSVGDPTKIQRIGRIVTTSEMIQSAPTDGIFFRHQVKEEDYRLRPQWEKAIDRRITMDGGKTKGTVGKLAGWRLFEEDIALEKYVDFGA